MNLTVNGKDVFAATGGRDFDKSLPAVVLLHGAGFDHSAWALHSRMIEARAVDQHDRGQRLVEIAAAGRREHVLAVDGEVHGSGPLRGAQRRSQIVGDVGCGFDAD